MEWSDGESNPDLLNAIQPSDSTKEGLQVTPPPSNVCKRAEDDKDLRTVIEKWDSLPKHARQAVLAMVQCAIASRKI